VTVDTIPETVQCDAKARPKAIFRWFREGSADTIMEGHVFDLKMAVPRRSNGTYYCEALNRHGALRISMVMNVQCTFHCIFRLRSDEGNKRSLDWETQLRKGVEKKTASTIIAIPLPPFPYFFSALSSSSELFIFIPRYMYRKVSNFL